MQQQHQVPQHSLQTVPICLNGQMAMATVDSSQSDSIDLSLVWPKTGESWTGHYSSDLVAKLLPGRPYSAFLQMLKAAIAERNRPSSDLRLHLDKPTIEHPDLQHLVLTYRTRFEQIECRLPLNRQRSDSARTETDADDEDRMLDAAGLRQAARQLEQENARLRRENAQLRPAASSAAQLRLEVAAMREAARGLEAELQSSVTASASPRGAVGNASSSAMKKLQSEARELRAMERMLQLRLSQVLRELALHKRARVHGPAAVSANASPVASRVSTPRRCTPRFDPTAYVTERRQRRPTSADDDRRRPQRSAASSAKKAKSKKPLQPASSGPGLGGVEEDVLQIDARLDRLQSFLDRALTVR